MLDLPAQRLLPPPPRPPHPPYRTPHPSQQLNDCAGVLPSISSVLPLALHTAGPGRVLVRGRNLSGAQARLLVRSQAQGKQQADVQRALSAPGNACHAPPPWPEMCYAGSGHVCKAIVQPSHLVSRLAHS